MKTQIEKLVEKKQKLNLEKARLEDKHTIKEQNYENKIDKLRNEKYQEKQTYEFKLKKIERAIDKTARQITLEKSFVSTLDKD
jgi:hypothetical protein